MMNTSRHIIGPITPIAQKNFCQTSPPSAWQLQKKADQILELRQQIQTTNPNHTYKMKKLQQKLKQLVCQQGLHSSQRSPSSSASDCSAPASPALPIRPKNPLNAATAEWYPQATTVSAPLPDHTFSSSITVPRVLRFVMPPPAEHIVHQEHKWGLAGLNPYTRKLLSSSLLDAINIVDDSRPLIKSFEEDEDDDSEFYPHPPISWPLSFAD